MKKLGLLFTCLLFTLSLASCIKERVEPPTKPSINIPDESGTEDSSKPTENNPEVEDVIFSVSLIAEGKPYIPKRDEEIIVVWDNLNGETHEAKIGEDGFARVKNLDGDFFVRLSKLPERYTYNPNDSKNFVNRDNPDITLELKKLIKLRGKGTGLYAPDVYQMSTEGYCRATVEFRKPVYFEFIPKVEGTYIFESICDTYANNINPVAYVYIGTSSFKPSTPSEVVSSGGYTQGGYTDNFKLKFSVSKNMLGNVYTFGVLAETKDKEYPAVVDFLILNEADYEDVNPIVGLMQVARELDKAKITEDFTGKTLINTDGGSGNYYDRVKAHRTFLDGRSYKYIEEEGIYYYYDYENDKKISPLLCYITSPCPYYENSPQSALSSIQAAGNKALTVKNKKGEYFDYSKFIEEQYAGIADSKGLVKVTKELKDFLLMFSNSQRLFMDGNGYIEDQFNVMSNGEDQWLFCCCYYI